MRPAVLLLELDGLVSARRLNRLFPVLVQGRHEVAIEIGEASVGIAVSARHRAEAFDAARDVIDTLKRTVPIWKREHFEDGAVWVGEGA